jgi:hypothetical protein
LPCTTRRLPAETAKPSAPRAEAPSGDASRAGDSTHRTPRTEVSAVPGYCLRVAFNYQAIDRLDKRLVGGDKNRATSNRAISPLQPLVKPLLRVAWCATGGGTAPCGQGPLAGCPVDSGAGLGGHSTCDRKGDILTATLHPKSSEIDKRVGGGKVALRGSRPAGPPDRRNGSRAQGADGDDRSANGLEDVDPDPSWPDPDGRLSAGHRCERRTF